MTPTPEQSAVAEQAAREAAFARARRKLVLADSAFERSRRQFSTGDRVGMWLMGACAVLVVVGIPLACLWTEPDATSPGTWLGNPGYPAALLGPPLVALALLTLIWRGRRTATEEDAASCAVDYFYLHVRHPVGTSGMDQHLIVADLDHAPRRPPPFETGANPPDIIRNKEGLEEYWKALCKYDGSRGCAFEVRKSDMVRLSPTLMLANVTLAVRRLGTRQYLLAVLLIVLLSTGRLLFDQIAGSLGNVASGLSWGAFFVLVLVLLRSLQGKRVAEFGVRKLVVKCGENWRMFNGEWEGWEEADLSWLDDPGVGEIATYPVSSPAPRA